MGRKPINDKTKDINLMARQLKRTHAVLVGDVLKDGRRLGHFDVSIDEIGELLEEEIKQGVL